MKRLSVYLVLFAAASLPAPGQQPVITDLNQALADANQQIADATRQMANMHFRFFQTSPFPGDFSSGDFSIGGFSSQYEAGMRALDERKYDAAIKVFDRVVAVKSPRADGALYWKAYALNRLGRRDEAIATIAALRRDYPKSRWLDDAQVLEVEVRQNSGTPISPAAESNEDIKLIAINGLMNADPNRAVPLLEGILKGPGAPKVKDRAMFVLAESRSPRAQQVLADYAKGSANPDLQIRAMRYMGMSGTPETQQLLVTVYSSSTDASVKRAVVQSLFMAGASAKMIELARKERDPEMKKTIVQYLSLMDSKDATDYMMELIK
jgi:tetratricopeptide (TPR) repeat protein